ncbi:MAG TPA: YceI family protein [Tepidisphaeraceae bacterium]|nr:YceI family protein [Tepidisphaeraceae bacterium]
MNTRIASFAAFVGLSVSAAAFAPAAQYKVDPVHSFVNFKVNHLGVSYVWGRFDGPEGTFNTDEGKESFEATVHTDKIDTGVAKRDQHLKSPDFFNAKQFPELTFKSTGVKKSGENQYEVTGDMTVHGVTKSITVTLTKVGEAKTQMGERAGFDGTFTIKRSDFGMAFMPGAVGDEITVYVGMEGTKE